MDQKYLNELPHFVPLMTLCTMGISFFLYGPLAKVQNWKLQLLGPPFNEILDHEFHKVESKDENDQDIDRLESKKRSSNILSPHFSKEL